MNPKQEIYSHETRCFYRRARSGYCARRAVAGVRRAGTLRRRRAGHPDQLARSRLHRGSVLQHGLRGRSVYEYFPRRDPPRRPLAAQFQPALQGAGPGPRHGLLARPPHDRRRLDRIELGRLHRHRDQQGEAYYLCRPRSARGVFHPRRQGGLGHGARRELCRRARRQDLRGEDPHHHAGWAWHADLLAGRQIRLRLFLVQSRDGCDLRSRRTRSSPE